MQRVRVGRCSRSATPMWICEQALASGQGRSGELAPSEAADIAKAVDIYVRALATQEFEERLAKLENNPAPASVPADADA